MLANHDPFAAEKFSYLENLPSNDYVPLGQASLKHNDEETMTTFNDREKAFESKFIHDQDVQFRVFARRNHLLGLWAGEKLDKHGDDASEYALSVVAADLAERGDDDVLRKVSADFKAGSVHLSDAEIRQKMDALLAEAKSQIASGK